ncbi:MAG: TonB-dependent receptor [Pseudomonadota bacterium]
MSCLHSTAALFAAAFCLPVLADDATRLDPVQVTATRTAESSFDVAQPVTVLGAGQIGEKTPQVMAELLRGQPGVFFQQTGAGQGMAIVRGLKGAEVLHLVDGFRLNNAFFRTAPSQYIALVDPYNISQLEVLRGPYATLYGSDAMGGVVQITTPEERFEGEKPDYRTKVLGHYASADLAKVGRISHAIGNKTLSVAGGYTTASYGNRKVGKQGQFADGNGNISLNDRVGPSEYTARSYDVKAIYTPASAHELMLSYQLYDVPSGFPRYNEVVPGSKPIVASENPARFESLYFNSREFFHLRYRYSAPLAFVDSLELHLGRQVIEDNRYDRFMPNASTVRIQLEENRSTLDGLTAGFVSTAGAHRLTYGVELYQDQIDSTILRKNNAAAFIPSSASSLAFKSRFPNGAETDNYGVYLADSFRATDRLLLDFGLRGNATETTLPAAPDSDRSTGFKVDSTDYSAQAGLRYALTPQLAYTLNAGRGYRAPNVNDLAAVGSRSNNRYVVSNPALKPETINSIDTGFKWRASGLSGEVVLFYSKYDDRIDLISNAVPRGTGECPATGETNDCSQNRNIQKAEYYGLEAALRYQLASNLTAYGTLNTVRAEKKVNGTTEPGNRIPPLNGVLGAEWLLLPTVVIEPSLWMNATQDRLDSVDRADNRIANGGTAGFAVLNLRAGWKPNDTYRVQLFGENLLDKQYREHGSGIDGRGRGVGITAEAKF